MQLLISIATIHSLALIFEICMGFFLAFWLFAIFYSCVIDSSTNSKADSHAFLVSCLRGELAMSNQRSWGISSLPPVKL